jgi:predicted DCC family thiol-disulfide oxidoreductase YuxK
MHAIDARGRVFRGARAMAEVWRRLPGYRRVLGAVAAYPPVLWPAELVYRWVAKNRWRLGKQECAVDRPRG